MRPNETKRRPVANSPAPRDASSVPALAAMFWARVERTPTCWIWRGAMSRAGYGIMWAQGQLWYAHICAWWLMYGDVPRGSLLRRVCATPRCVKPEFGHVYPVAHRTRLLAMRRDLRAQRQRLQSDPVLQQRVLACHEAGQGVAQIARAERLFPSLITDLIVSHLTHTLADDTVT